MATFTVNKDTRGQFYWLLKASNGEIIAVSETYLQKTSAMHTIKRVQELAAGASIKDETGTW